MNLVSVIPMMALCAIGLCSTIPNPCAAQTMNPQMSSMSDSNWDQLPPPANHQTIYDNPQCTGCQPAHEISDPAEAARQRAMNHARAGCPLLLSKHATHTYDSNYQGYYVGGGVPAGRKNNRGESRYCSEGTWGVDYAPWYTRVALRWSHGHLFQGGTGQYEPDHKNRPFGQTYGEHFGNRDRRFGERSD